MQRFAFVSTMEGNPWGGSEELWSQTALRLSEKGYRVSASVPHCDRPRAALGPLVGAGIDVYARGPAAASVWARAWRKLSGRRVAGLLSRRDASWLKGQRGGLICISQGGIADGLPWMFHCRRLGIPYAAIVQSNAEWLWPDDQQGERMALAYSSAQACYFVSQRNRELLEDQIGQALPNATVVHNPYNVRHDARPAWPASAPDWRLACVARLDPVAKGQDLLLRVLALEKWRSRALKVSFYGTGRCEQNLRRLASRFALTNVDFRGHVADVEQIWADNHGLVLPSRYEGTPLALVEAMLCARPSIVTDVAGNTELVEDGVSGFVASATSLLELDRALDDAWQRRHEWPAIGEIARQRVASLVPRDPVQLFCDRLTSILPR
jgi:glycosyltransferase involved in cell wall biosynthesis